MFIRQCDIVCIRFMNAQIKARVYNKCTFFYLGDIVPYKQNVDIFVFQKVPLYYAQYIMFMSAIGLKYS